MQFITSRSKQLLSEGALDDELLLLSEIGVVLPVVHHQHLPVLVTPELVEVG